MAGRDGKGERFIPGSRKQDRSVDDALRTMERLATWLATAEENDVWQQADDPLQVAMLHGMLLHLRQSIDQLLAAGGEEAAETAQSLRALAAQDQA
jgi:hypothetical protein